MDNYHVIQGYYIAYKFNEKLIKKEISLCLRPLFLFHYPAYFFY